MVKKYSTNKRLASPRSSSSKRDPDTSLSPILFEIGNYNHVDFLQKEGEKKLLQGESAGLKYFDQALQLDPENGDLLYQQGIALFEFGSEKKIKKYLLLANKKFKLATKIQEGFSRAWQAWGNTLLFLGECFSEHHFILSSREKYEKAISLAKHGQEEDLAELYWDYGKVMTLLSQQSGEVSDLNIALEALAKASSYNEHFPAQFWQDFGKVSLQLGMHINDIRLYMKAINCYKNAIRISISNFDSWFYLAHGLSLLYQLTHDEDHYCQANECFTNAAKLNPQNKLIWLDWAKLLLYSGKHLKDEKRLHSSLEKCHRAYSCNRNDPDIMVVWSETLSILGELSERLELIYEGNNKYAEALDHYGGTPEICYAGGVNNIAFGKYYCDLDYFYQAVERFQEGLSIDRSKHKLWQQLGYTYSLIAEQEQDLQLLERAGKFYRKAISLHAESHYYYQYALTLTKIAEMERDQKTLEDALIHYEQAFSMQKDVVFLHPEWLFQYAQALDLMGDFVDEDKYYIKSIEILKRVLMLDPDFPGIHYKIAFVYSHLGELTSQPELYKNAIAHYKIAFQENEENEALILDWSLALINLSEITGDLEEREELWREAEYKLIQSAKLGSVEVYYHLACLYSIMRQYEKAMYFIEKAERFDSLPPLEEVMEDDWLDNLRTTEIFRSFINHLQNID